MLEIVLGDIKQESHACSWSQAFRKYHISAGKNKFSCFKKAAVETFVKWCIVLHVSVGKDCEAGNLEGRE